MLIENKIDVVVVSANSLDARRVKEMIQTLTKINIDREKKNKNQSEKEAAVIWGRPEVSKLFATSHNS